MRRSATRSRLSVTPEYLVKIGLLDTAPDASRDIGLLMARALEKVAFLPFGLVIDQWRWDVFSGKVTPANYNKAWWDLPAASTRASRRRAARRGVLRSGRQVSRAGELLVYTRYFLAHILQFQFHRELSKIAGCTTPLHRCSIYGSKEAGTRLNAMLAMGQSRQWPDALEALTGSRQMDATAIVDYFAPLKTWLDQQLEQKGQKTGW